jgi:plasmid stabilization system protein ParE
VRIVFTEAADRQLDEITDWWLANRPGSTLLLRELDAAYRVLLTTPSMGTPHRHDPLGRARKHRPLKTG